jgi:hypothetical protein
MDHFRLISASLLFPVFLLLGLGGGSITVNRTAAFSPSFLPPLNSVWVSSSTSVTFDFDGDRRSDLAVGRTEGNTYRVEIRLTTQPEKPLTALTSNALGISLLACDIDRDNDQDLVVSSPTSLYPLAVWLSDGNGHFEEGNRWLYIDLLAEDNSADYDQNNSQPDQVSIGQEEHSPFDKPFVNLEETRSEEDGIAGELQTPPSSILAYSLAPRSPPFFPPSSWNLILNPQPSHS